LWWLNHPVVRVAAKDTPIPTSPPLEDAVLPQTADVIQTLRKVATT
jgi:2-oxoisovalerate dehydrogenase E1 component beta subunit